MSAEDWRLVGVAVSLFILLGLLGWLRPKCWLWRWADVIYYPLAALSIILLFFTNDINRALLRIEARQAAAEQAWRDRPNPRPELEFEAGSAGLLDARYRWFAEVRRLGEICRESTTRGCIAHSDHADALRDTFGNFVVPPEGDKVALARAEERFCQAGFAYVDRLAKGGVFGLGGYERLKAALADLAKGGGEDRLKAKMEAQAAESERVFATVANAKERATVEPYIVIEREHSTELLSQLGWCATRDNRSVENLRTLDAWQREETNRAQTRATIARDLEIARKTRPQTPLQQASRALQQQWWPYILVLALSIKFGKATSGIAGDLDRLARRSASALSTIAGWRRLLRRKAKQRPAPPPHDDDTAAVGEQSAKAE